MALKRIIGIETEYGISGGEAHEVLSAYKRKKAHTNIGKTNESIIRGMTDVGGHIGGDYGALEGQIKETGFSAYTYHTYNYPAYYRSSYTYSYNSDGVLPNGSLFYEDMGHPEYSTPETSNPRDLVIADKAGELIVQEAADNTGKKIIIYKNNSDGKGNSYGCHENYLIKRFSEKEFIESVVPALVPFFLSRQIFTGSGKIGVESPGKYSYSSYPYNKCVTENWDINFMKAREEALESLVSLERHFLDIPEFNELRKSLLQLCKKREDLGEQQIFQLSQRSDFLEALIGLQTTYNRPIINTRDEPHADSEKYMRLHVICGDANMCEIAAYLKVGTTSLVLDLIEDRIAPIINLQDPVRAIKTLSWDQKRKWELELENGKITTAIEIQHNYLETARTAYKRRDEITDEILARWEETLNLLERNPMELVGKIDWVTKLFMLNHLMEKEAIPLTHHRIKNAALQYHDINKQTSPFYFMQNRGLIEKITDDKEILYAKLNPPKDTRAFLRGKVSSLPYVSSVDWGGFTISTRGERREVKLKEPFAGREQDLQYIFKETPSAKKLIDRLEEIEGIEITEPFFSKSKFRKKIRKEVKQNAGKKTISDNNKK